MRERPILFSAPMVRAILSGQKSMTRRVVKPQPEAIPQHVWRPRDLGPNRQFWWPCSAVRQMVDLGEMRSFCPYGVPGDRLWVRETWRHWPVRDGADQREGLDYRATDEDDFEYPVNESIFKWRSPIHMPRWASRLTLTITDVRVERVQDINDDDAIAEGIPDYPDFKGDCPVDDYRELWDSLNAARGYGWDANPWVWALTFSVADCAAAGRVVA